MDIVDRIEEHNEEENLLDKLGIKPKPDKLQWEDMNAKEKEDHEKWKEELAEHTKKADKLIEDS